MSTIPPTLVRGAPGYDFATHADRVSRSFISGPAAGSRVGRDGRVSPRYERPPPATAQELADLAVEHALRTSKAQDAGLPLYLQGHEHGRLAIASREACSASRSASPSCEPAPEPEHKHHVEFLHTSIDVVARRAQHSGGRVFGRVFPMPVRPMPPHPDTVDMSTHSYPEAARAALLRAREVTRLLNRHRPLSILGDCYIRLPLGVSLPCLTPPPEALTPAAAMDDAIGETQARARAGAEDAACAAWVRTMVETDGDEEAADDAYDSVLDAAEAVAGCAAAGCDAADAARARQVPRPGRTWSHAYYQRRKGDTS